MGFVLAAMACTQWDRWGLAGALIALAFLSQQYALLVAVPLLVLAPVRRRVPYVVAAAATYTVIVLPLLAVTSGRALRTVVLGSGNGPWFGFTVLGKLNLPGLAVVLLSRVLPVALAGALAWWVLRRFGAIDALRPIALLSVIALSLGLRLVFEENLYSYYFMALAVCLVLLDVARGRIRGSLVAWLAGLTLLFFQEWSYPLLPWFPWMQGKLSPLFVVITVTLAVTLAARRGITGWHFFLAFAVLARALVTWPAHGDPIRFQFPLWFWQVIFVASGVALAGGPLLAELRTNKVQEEVALARTSSAVSG